MPGGTLASGRLVSCTLAPRCRIDPERALEEVVRVAHPAADPDGHLFGADEEGLADVHAERGETAVGPGLAGGRWVRDAPGRALVADHGGVGEGAPTRDGGTDERDAESVHLGDARHPFDVGAQRRIDPRPDDRVVGVGGIDDDVRALGPQCAGRSEIEAVEEAAQEQQQHDEQRRAQPSR